MIILNVENIEDLILKNRDLHSIFKDLRYILDQWYLTCKMPFLHNKKQIILDFLNSITDKHIELLQYHFKDTVVVNKLDYKIVKNLELCVDEPLQQFDNEFANLAISRDETKIYLTFWR